MFDGCPCVDCHFRNAECHASCQAYKSWRKDMDEIRDLRNIMSKTEDYFNKPKRRRRERTSRDKKHV